jgi:hypothetical protein
LNGQWDYDSVMALVTGTCAEVFGLPVQAADDFFSLGVSSIEVASVRTRLLNRLDVDIPFRLLLEAADFSRLCEALLRLAAAPGAETSRIRPRAKGTPQQSGPGVVVPKQARAGD